MRIIVLASIMLLLMGNSCADKAEQVTNISRCEDIQIFAPNDPDNVPQDDEGDATFAPASIDGSGDNLGDINLTLCGKGFSISENELADNNLDVSPELGLGRRLTRRISIEGGTIDYIELTR